jgi:hypothetical protein
MWDAGSRGDPQQMANQPESKVEKLPDGSTSIQGPGGAWIIVAARTPDVMYMRMGGFLVGGMMARALAALDDVVKDSAPFTLVIDAEAQSGYEPEVRTSVTKWLAAHGDRIRPCHVLARAPLVRMGAEMINVALRRKVFQMYKERSEFERTVSQVVRDSERLRAARRSD